MIKYCKNCSAVTKVDTFDKAQLMLDLFDTDYLLEVRKKALSNRATEVAYQTIGTIYGAEIKCQIIFKGDI